MANAPMGNQPSVRFFCHRCNLYMNEDIIEDFTCPFCGSGFLEQVENEASVPQQGQTFRDANMSNIRDASNRSNINHLPFPLNNLPTILQDVAFLMSGNELSEASRQRLRNDVRWSMVGSQERNRPQGAMPLVFMGTPGEFALGGEALDAVVAQLFGQLEHSGAPPMPQDILSSIPKETVTEEQASTNMPCSVCWENFQLGETISRLECDHIFHSTCINPWLELHATCPVCRRSLLPPDHRPEPPTPSTTTTTTTTTTNTTNGGPPRQRPFLSPRVVIRRSTHPLFRRAFQTNTWDSQRDMSISSDSTSSVTTGGVWASQTPSDTSSNSSASDRTQNYHTDFDCD